jgi:hypothetical protein
MPPGFTAIGIQQKAPWAPESLMRCVIELKSLAGS